MFANQDCPAVKIDSNFTGLRYAWEICLKQLPVAVDGVAGSQASVAFNLAGSATEGDTFSIDGTEFTFMDVVTDPDTELLVSNVSTAAQATALASSLTTVIAGTPSLAGKYTVSAFSTEVAILANGEPGSEELFNGIEVGGVGTAFTGGELDTVLSSAVNGIAASAGPVWHVLEPNSYSDFGSTINTVARNPIKPNRQRRKGTVTGVDASAGINHDLTFNSTTDLMQGFCFALAREKPTTTPLNAADREVTGVGAGYEFDNADGAFATPTGAALIVHASGFSASGNNGVKVTTAVTGSGVTAAGLTAEASPPEFAAVRAVGAVFASGDLSITMNGGLVRLNTVNGDFTSGGENYNFILGEWLFLGGDGVNDRFANNVGFARISAIDEAGGLYLEFDKVSWPAPVAESGAGKTIHLYYGTVIRSEPDPADIVRGSLQLERTLGQDADGTMSEYIIGAVPNELTLNIAQEDKATVDISFIACDAEHRTGAQGLKAGDRPLLEAFDAFNTSSDFYRIKMASVSNVDAAPVPLFAYCTDMSMAINNNGSANKAVGSLSAIDISNGDFEVSGEVTAYFANIASVQAVRNNADITIDAILVKDNKGLLFDIPLLGLGNGRLNVEKDQAITLPLETNAAESKFGHTLLFQSFEYLPNIATP